MSSVNAVMIALSSGMVSLILIILVGTFGFLFWQGWIWIIDTGTSPLAMMERLKSVFIAAEGGAFFMPGLFPAIIGTAVMTLLMTILVAPLGVATAIYLTEYAQNTPSTRLTRIAIHNLAGVPSIVYGVFGLGFFAYGLGANIDNIFFADQLPQPTFGTPGLLWAALTLALLTLPTVVVAAEEGLLRIPQILREGSLALGATRYDTIRRIVLPAALPSVLTGLILAIARAAGEVAPLMLVGAVKYAPELPLSTRAPFVAFEQKFMHLGVQVYDSALYGNDNAGSLGVVAVTAVVLVSLITLLNLTAIVIRHTMMRRYSTEGEM
jgi:phosphate transport system permease protein